MIGEAVRRMLAPEADIRFHYCSDPAEALKMARELAPTVILQDLVMPEIDGLTLVKFYRAEPALRDTPLIVLSTKEEPATKAEAFALGANDYLVKLPDRIELVARIRYHSQGYINLLERNEAYQALLASQKALAAELAEAALSDTLETVAKTNCGARTLVLDGEPGGWLPEGFEVVPQTGGAWPIGSRQRSPGSAEKRC